MCRRGGWWSGSDHGCANEINAMHTRCMQEGYLMDWYPFYPLDFRRKTLKLSLAEDGAYRRLIDEYMLFGGPLPNDDIALARLLGIGIEEWLAVAPVVRGYFQVQNGLLRSKRCEEELAAQKKRNQRFSERGKKAAFGRWSKINDIPARRMLVHATVHNKDKSSSFSQSVAASPQGASDEEDELTQISRRRGWIR
jgi:uncharacterized protein YdaU (DUF1376 family)